MLLNPQHMPAMAGLIKTTQITILLQRICQALHLVSLYANQSRQTISLPGPKQKKLWVDATTIFTFLMLLRNRKLYLIPLNQLFMWQQRSQTGTIIMINSSFIEIIQLKGILFTNNQINRFYARQI
ncbi:hypothetical protein FGO68_gene10092 [Halteria grandinella]|uniref:Uncharacterized protein n=1 Tax=Halteria grandinella TaxID=5974 RepID=A0A8J8SZL5_HALGN|nr:hypothetical protein FGO68_gene10092 [Halteria grandinella]